jgi:hypothetical protein
MAVSARSGWDRLRCSAWNEIGPKEDLCLRRHRESQPPACGAESEGQMIKPKRSAEQQVADEADRKTLNPVSSRQTISDSQAEPEFQENHKRLKADRLARESVLKAKGT